MVHATNSISQWFTIIKKNYSQLKKNFICYGFLEKDARIWLGLWTLQWKITIEISRTICLSFQFCMVIHKNKKWSEGSSQPRLLWKVALCSITKLWMLDSPPMATTSVQGASFSLRGSLISGVGVLFLSPRGPVPSLTVFPPGLLSCHREVRCPTWHLMLR